MQAQAKSLFEGKCVTQPASVPYRLRFEIGRLKIIREDALREHGKPEAFNSDQGAANLQAKPSGRAQKRENRR
jgi:hypothetical protein